MFEGNLRATQERSNRLWMESALFPKMIQAVKRTVI